MARQSGRPKFDNPTIRFERLFVLFATGDRDGVERSWRKESEAVIEETSCSTML